MKNILSLLSLCLALQTAPLSSESSRDPFAGCRIIRGEHPAHHLYTKSLFFYREPATRRIFDAIKYEDNGVNWAINEINEAFLGDAGAFCSDGTPFTTLAIVKKHRVEVIKALVDHGASVNTASLITGWTPLMAAASGNKLLIDDSGRSHVIVLLEYLLSEGAHINAQANDGTTALMAAASQGNCEAVEYLLNHGADARLRKNGGKTAWDLACQNDHTACAGIIYSHLDKQS